jgi:hypothetical protein
LGREIVEELRNEGHVEEELRFVTPGNIVVLGKIDQQ